MSYLDNEILEIKKKELIGSLSNENKNVEEAIDQLIDYLYRFTDQRKKPSEPHGLDICEHEGGRA